MGKEIEVIDEMRRVCGGLLANTVDMARDWDALASRVYIAMQQCKYLEPIAGLAALRLGNHKTA